MWILVNMFEELLFETVFCTFRLMAANGKEFLTEFQVSSLSFKQGFITIGPTQQWALAFFSSHQIFTKAGYLLIEWNSRVALCPKSLRLSAVHTPGQIWRNHPLLIGLRGRQSNHRSVLKRAGLASAYPQTKTKATDGSFCCIREK